MDCLLPFAVDLAKYEEGWNRMMKGLKRKTKPIDLTANDNKFDNEW